MTEPIDADIKAETERALDSELMLAAGRHPLASSVERAMFERCGIDSDSTLLVGCSGGADSAALAVLIATLAARRDSTLNPPILLHVDHGLRAGSSSESVSVAGLASRIGIPFHSVRLELDKRGSDLSATARRARYAAMHDVAVRSGVTHVACAHHADDRFETMIHGLCRGVGVDALSNPRWQRPMGDVTLIRPALGLSRHDLRTFCIDLGIDFFDDPTNSDVDTMRGGLRESVLPHLESRWPGASRRVSAAMDRMTVAAGSLDREIAAVLSTASADRLDLSVFVVDDRGFISAVLRKWILDFAESRNVDVSDQITASFFDDVARGVCDEERRPRTYECAGMLEVHLDVRSLAIILKHPS